MRRILISLVLLILFWVGNKSWAYQHFKVAIYCTKNDVEKLSNRDYFENTLAFMQQYIKIDKVYLEVHRRETIDEKTLQKVKRWFQEKGIETAAGITPTGKRKQDGHFGVLCYSNPEEINMLLSAMHIAARNFNECILDDFFFTSCKCPACIRAKGKRSWEEFRLQKMTQISRRLIEEARQINPQIQVVIKYPNWYEYYQFTGYNLSTQPQIFDGIYTGTETRDPRYTHQNLQPYQSYLIMRYLSHVAPGKNRGGWVDPLRRGTLNRYAQQLYLTLFSGSKEITLFHWDGLFQPADSGRQFLSDLIPTASAVFQKFDVLAPLLKEPQGLVVYKPLNSSGENFLPAYLGMLGIPMELTSQIPDNAKKVLFTANAADDPSLMQKLKQLLEEGKEIIITSGLLQRMEKRGIDELISVRVEGAVHIERTSDLLFRKIFSTVQPITLPKVVVPTNDCWAEVLGITPAGTAVPILTRTNYARGTVWMITVPDDFAELYFLPRESLWQIRSFLLDDQPVLIDAPSQVSLFWYGNNTIIVQSFLEHSTVVRLHFGKKVSVFDAMTGKALKNQRAAKGAVFEFNLPAQEFRVFQF